MDDEHFAVMRGDPDGTGVLVIANLSEADWHLSMPDARWRLLLDTGRGHDAGCEPEGDHGLCMHGRSASLWLMDAVEGWR